MIPSVARIVHFTDDALRCRAAIVANADQYQEETGAGGMFVGHLDLFVLIPPDSAYVYGVHQDELPPPDKIVAGERAIHKPGTWHWPERV